MARRRTSSKTLMSPIPRKVQRREIGVKERYIRNENQSMKLFKENSAYYDVEIIVLILCKLCMLKNVILFVCVLN